MKLGKSSRARIMETVECFDLGDARRNSRAAEIMGALAHGADRPLPRVVGSPAELEGTYRFMSSEQASYEYVMDGVAAATAERARAAQTVLAIHDTTSIRCPAADGDEVGWLDRNTAGFFFHHVLIVEPRNNGPARPIGFGGGQLWSRKRPPARRPKGKAKSSGASLAKQAKRESDRWLECVQQVEERLNGCKIINVLDREADNFRILHFLHERGDSYVIRSYHNRRVESEESELLREALDDAPEIFSREVKLTRRLAKSKDRSRGAHPARHARETTLSVSAKNVVMVPPQYLSECSSLSITVVRVREVNPPVGEKPVEWTLLTNEPAENRQQVENIIDIYCDRWLIEEFHKALKTGCWVDKRNLESFEAQATNLALCLPIASEMLRLRAIVNHNENAPPTDVLTPMQLAALKAHPKIKSPQNPTVKDVLLAIASLGGHIKSNGSPGWRVLSRGLEDFLQFAYGFETALRFARGREM